MLTFLRQQEETLQTERSALQAELDGIVSTVQSESRTALTPEETALFDQRAAALDAKDTEIAEMRKRITDAEERESRAALVAQVAVETQSTGPSTDARTRSNSGAGANWRVGSEPTTYQRGGQHSFFRDLMTVNLNRPSAASALDRLTRNAQENTVESRALSTTDGAGGDFVPPVWMVEQYIALARAARPTADRVLNQPLPSGTDSLNIPKLATGTAVAEQGTQNTSVQNTDATTGAVTASVATLAGQQVVAVQLIEQSPINMDEILLADLAADYAAKVDLFVLNNNAANKKGLLQETGTNAITYTSGSPTVALLYSQIANAQQTIYTNRFMPADTIVMHPRRWAYFLAAVDSGSRPLVVPTAGQNPMNALATASGSTNGVVGNIAGLDVIVDPQVPTNLGAGTNQDPVIVLRASDSILWEGPPNAEAFRETKADQLSVLIRFYRYAAFTTARYPKSVAVINGTGLVAPVF